MKQLSNGVILAGLSLIVLTLVSETHFKRLPSTAAWPNFFCHRLYDHTHQKTYPMAVMNCRYGEDYRAIVDTKYNLEDTKSCMLWRLGAIIRHENKTFEYVEDHGLRKTLLTIFGGHSPTKQTPKATFRRGTFVTNMLQGSKRCKGILNEVANLKKLSSEKWTPFYDCIERAWVMYYVYDGIFNNYILL